MVNPSQHTLFVIAGPTAIGKTAVAIALAQKLNTVILSADSRQCYRELNIGVARPSHEELAAVPHYFIASHSIHQNINAAFFERYAMDLLPQLFERHSTVIVSGGTGLYIKALTEGLDPVPAAPPDVRAKISTHFQQQGIEWLQKQLKEKDPLFFACGEMQNPHRMVRALEVRETTGQSILSFRTGVKAARPFKIIQTALETSREALYKKINTRVDAMMAEGLEAEARNLLPHRTLTALQTVGYRELFAYFDGSLSATAAVEMIKQNTRRYAKRQMTWFKKQSQIQWLPADTHSAEQTATRLLSLTKL